VAHEVAGSNPVSHPNHMQPSSERDETRPIQCTACGRSFTRPRWFGLQGPLCGACFDRLQREEQVRLIHTQKPIGLRGWLRGLLGR
jgi:hypothetical protein